MRPRASISKSRRRSGLRRNPPGRMADPDDAADEITHVLPVAYEVQDARQESPLGRRVYVHDRPVVGVGNLAGLVVAALLDDLLPRHPEKTAAARARAKRGM